MIRLFLKTLSRLLVALSGAMVAAVAPAGAHEPRVRDTRPNIVLILADDLGVGDIGPYGQTKIRTPHLDALARDGIRFTQFYAGTTVCAPSRAALLTGRHTGHTEIRGNIRMGGDFTDEREFGQYPLASGTFSLPQMLRGAGYRTAAIGKWGLGGKGSAGIPTRQGFDYFFGYLDQSHAHNYYPTHLWENESWAALRNPFFFVHPGVAGTSRKPEDYPLYVGEEYAPYRILASAEDFLSRQTSGQPFFLYYASPLPHAALQIPEELLEEYRDAFPETGTGGGDYSPHRLPRAARAAMITRLDDEVGRLRARLRESGLEKNTLILFLSDNGPSSEGGADLEFFQSTGGLRGQKRDLYEGGIRSPLIAVWPGRIPAGKTSNTIAAAWDIMPTLADMVQHRAPGSLDGKSFLSALRGRPMFATRPLYWEMHGDGRSAQAAREGRWKAVRYQPGGFDPNRPLELYDLDADPLEKHDVARRYPRVAKRMKDLLGRRTQSDVPQFDFPAPPPN